MQLRILLTDLDNTLFNWVDFFAPSFRAMVHALSHSTGVAEDLLYDQFKAVYSRHATLEYQLAMQELPVIQSLTPEQRERALRAGFVAFSGTRRNRLREYEGVTSTLQWLVQEHVRVVALTNSPIWASVARLRNLGIESLFDAIAGWGSAPGSRRVQTRIPNVVELAEDQLKPSLDAFEAALGALPGYSRSAKVWVLGDSLSKDLAPAVRLGATTIWAKYGQAVNPDNYATLLRITYWSDAKIKTTYSRESFQPDHAIDGIGELRRIIPLVQRTLFDEEREGG